MSIATASSPFSICLHLSAVVGVESKGLVRSPVSVSDGVTVSVNKVIRDIIIVKTEPVRARPHSRKLELKFKIIYQKLYLFIDNIILCYKNIQLPMIGMLRRQLMADQFLELSRSHELQPKSFEFCNA